MASRVYRRAQPLIGCRVSILRSALPSLVAEITEHTVALFAVLLMGNDDAPIAPASPEIVVVTCTEAGTVATAVLLLARETVYVPGAATTVAVPVTVAPETLGFFEKLNDGAPVGLGGGATVMSALFVAPLRNAVISEQPAASDCTGNVRLLCRVRLEKVTDAGTVATDGVPLWSCTVTLPLAGAASRVTVPVELPPIATWAGDSVRLVSAITVPVQARSGRINMMERVRREARRVRVLRTGVMGKSLLSVCPCISSLGSCAPLDVIIDTAWRTPCWSTVRSGRSWSRAA